MAETVSDADIERVARAICHYGNGGSEYNSCCSGEYRCQTDARKAIAALTHRPPDPAVAELVEALKDALNFANKASGTALGVAMSGRHHPNPDGVLTDLSQEGMALSQLHRLARQARGLTEGRHMTAQASARQVLLDLADRCEIEEPHALLDAAIHAAVFGAMDLVDDLPAYTTSLDAAVTLTDWLLISLSDIAADGMIRCELGEPGRNLVAVSVGAKTRALALCAAALRAKAEALP